MEEAEDRASSPRHGTPVPTPKPSLPKEELDTEFKKKYPPEPLGEELADHARVWKVFRDEATKTDAAMLDGWNKTLDILLVFSGLFSAVVTTFVGQSNTQLRPDTNAYLANALFHLVTSNGNVSALPAPPSLDASPTSTVVWVNALWFTSLLLSLAVAFLCILAKQWIGEYVVHTTSSSTNTHDWCRRRAFYFRGLNVWGLPVFLSFLPVLLHISLFLFIAGLCLVMWAVSRVVALCLISVGGFVAVFYIVATFVPLWRPDCPTALPLITQIRTVVFRTSLAISRTSVALCIAGFPASRKAFWAFRRLILRPVYDAYLYIRRKARRGRVSIPPHSASEAFKVPFFDNENNYYNELVPQGLLALRGALVSLREKAVGKTFGDAQWSRVENVSDAEALRWLILECSDHDAAAVGYQALGAIVPNSEVADHIDNDHAVRDAISFERAFSYTSPAEKPRTTEILRVLRSVIFIQPPDINELGEPSSLYYGCRNSLGHVEYPDVVLILRCGYTDDPAILRDAAEEVALPSRTTGLASSPTIQSTLSLLFHNPSLPMSSFCALLYGASEDTLLSNRAFLAAKFCEGHPPSLPCILAHMYKMEERCRVPLYCLAETICAHMESALKERRGRRHRGPRAPDFGSLVPFIVHLISFTYDYPLTLFDMPHLAFCLTSDDFVSFLGNDVSIFTCVAQFVMSPDYWPVRDVKKYNTAMFITGLAKLCRQFVPYPPVNVALNAELSAVIDKVMHYTVFLIQHKPHPGLEVVSYASSFFYTTPRVHADSAFHPPWKDVFALLPWAPSHRFELAFFMTAAMTQYSSAGRGFTAAFGLVQLNELLVHLLRDVQRTGQNGDLLRGIVRHYAQFHPRAWTTDFAELEAGGVTYLAGEVTRDVIFLGPCTECLGCGGYRRWERKTEDHLIEVCTKLGVALNNPDGDLQVHEEFRQLVGMLDAIEGSWTGTSLQREPF